MKMRWSYTWPNNNPSTSWSRVLARRMPRSSFGKNCWKRFNQRVLASFDILYCRLWSALPVGEQGDETISYRVWHQDGQYTVMSVFDGEGYCNQSQADGCQLKQEDEIQWHLI